MVKETLDKETKRKNLTFIMLMFPSLLLAIMPSTIDGNAIYGLVIKVLLIGYQYFIAKSFVESAYN